MNSKQTRDDYYDRIRSIPLRDVIENFAPGSVTEETSQRLLVDCPVHSSQSKTSLHADLSRGLWFCHGCQAGGDAINFVEFTMYQAVSRSGGACTSQHREARDELARRFGMPTLSRSGMSAEEIEKAERNHSRTERVFAVLTKLTDFYHETLMADSALIAYVQKLWGFDEETMRRFKIGYSDGQNTQGRILTNETAADDDLKIQEKDLLATGAFTTDNQDRPVPLFKHRVTIPYYANGRVVYMIGRQSPFGNPGGQMRGSKYMKLPEFHADHKRYVAGCIQNGTLFGEDIIRTRPKRVVITEGIADAIATQANGFPCISPVTVSISTKDMPRMIQALKGVPEVFIIQDEEFSGIGARAALGMARTMGEAGIRVRIGTLPMAAEQLNARQAIRELVGASAYAEINQMNPRKRARYVQSILTPEQGEEYKKLAGLAKIDLCDWWRTEGSPEAFDAILANAETPLGFAIKNAPNIQGSDHEKIQACKALLTEIGFLPIALRSEMLVKLKDVIGAKLTHLRSYSSTYVRERKAEMKKDGKTAAKTSAVEASLEGGEPGSLRDVLARLIEAARDSGRSVSWENLARETYDWFSDRQGVFFSTEDESPYLFFNAQVVSMSKGTRFNGFMMEHANLTESSTGGRQLFDALRGLCVTKGTRRPMPTWIHTDPDGPRVYVNLNNPNNQIMAISTLGAELQPNGANQDGALLAGSSKLKPLSPPLSCDHRRLEETWKHLIGDHLATTNVAKATIFSWLVALPMLEISGTRPMLRLEGQPGSGKTWASKMLTTLIYGSQMQKKSTVAANYVDASINPLVALDNVEMSNATPDFVDFLLTCATGIRREKRKGNSDSDNVSESPNAMVMSTGVEPLGGALAEVMSRSFVLNFDQDKQAAAMIESTVIRGIQVARDELMGLIFARCAAVLDIIGRLDGHARAMAAIEKEMPGHTKRRCNEFLALMYLIIIAGGSEETLETNLDDLSPFFAKMISSMNEETASVVSGSVPEVNALTALFAELNGSTPKTYGITLESNTMIRRVSTGQLFAALTKVSGEWKQQFGYRNAQQFSRRMKGNLQAIEDAGFDIELTVGTGNKTFVTIHDRREYQKINFPDGVGPDDQPGDSEGIEAGVDFDEMDIDDMSL